jgi:cytochrome c oxidase cbb3-type subunit 3
MIFAALYFAFYQLGGGPTSDDELKASLAAVGSKIEESKELSNQVNWDELAKDPKTMELGKSVFMGKCGSCHGMSGEGLIGPNLTDKFWIHGDGTSAAIHKVILEGVLEKGMPAWQAQLKPEESDAVTVYIRSLRGTQPANPKAPQGTEVL